MEYVGRFRYQELEPEEGFDKPFGCDFEDFWGEEQAPGIRLGGAADFAAYDEPLYGDGYYQEYDQGFRQEYHDLPLFPSMSYTSSFSRTSPTSLPSSQPRLTSPRHSYTAHNTHTQSDLATFTGRTDYSQTRRSNISSNPIASRATVSGRQRSMPLTQQARLNAAAPAYEGALPEVHRQRRLTRGNTISAQAGRMTRSYPTPPTSPLATEAPISLSHAQSYLPLTVPTSRYPVLLEDDYGMMEDITARRRRRALEQ